MGLVIDWESPDPGALGARFADRLRLPRPDPGEDRFALRLAGGSVRVARAAAGGRERLVAVATLDEESAWASRGVPREPGALADAPGVQLLGVAWATVEMARATRELADRFGLEPGDFALADDDAWLGAAARVAVLGRSRLVALEPTTEGRVAAALARFGEGPVAIYLGLPGPASGPVRRGPLGAGSLMTGSPVWGPFAIVVADPVEAAASAAD